MRERGTVKKFNEEKGWGFVHLTNRGEDAFVHHSNINMRGFKKLIVGQNVECEVETTDKGLKCLDLEVVES